MSRRMQQIVLRSHPLGAPRAQDFALETVDIPAVNEGQLLLRTLWLSLDPMIRFALDAQPLTGPNRVRIGEPIFGGTVSQVIQSRHADFKSGDFVEGRTGWREYAAIDPQRVPLRNIDPRPAPLRSEARRVGNGGVRTG